MSLTSASPDRASLEPEVIHISTSPLPVTPRTRTSTSHNRHRTVQPPAAQSSSPRYQARHASSSNNNTRTNHSRRSQSPNAPSSPSYWASQQLAADAAAADSLQRERGVTTPLRRRAAATASAVTQEPFLHELLDHDFSSPSTYPSFTNPPQTNPGHDAETTQTSECHGTANDANIYGPDSPSLQLQAGPSASTTQNTDSTLVDTQDSSLFYDLIDEQQPNESASTSFSDSMPAATRTRNTQPFETAYPPLKRRRASPTQPKQEKSAQTAMEEDLFGDAVDAPAAANPLAAADGLTAIDLTEANEVPQELTRPVVDNRTKIAAFQCVICMDDVTNLTLTACGHLFCALCLHQSLGVETTKGRCPMCRSKIDMKPRESYTTKTKGFWPLELKLMTVSRKGKRKADEISK